MNLPDPNKLKITSLEESTEILKLLLLKIQELEEREPVRDQGLTEEIIHLRQETREGFSSLRQEMEDRLDENTLAIKSLETVMKGGFENVGRVLQEISNKLNK